MQSFSYSEQSLLLRYSCTWKRDKLNDFWTRHTCKIALLCSKTNPISDIVLTPYSQEHTQLPPLTVQRAKQSNMWIHVVCSTEVSKMHINRSKGLRAGKKRSTTLQNTFPVWAVAIPLLLFQKSESVCGTLLLSENPVWGLSSSYGWWRGSPFRNSHKTSLNTAAVLSVSLKPFLQRKCFTSTFFQERTGQLQAVKQMCCLTAEHYLSPISAI